jgi:predicted nuclease of restriction endonuclease-like RecB superfamily
MLPLQLVRCRSSRHRLVPQYLDPSSANWRGIAEQVLELFRSLVGRSRGELEAELNELIGNHPGQIVFRGLAKLLEDRCAFEMPSEHPPEQVRERVFTLASAHRAVGRFDRNAILAEVAAEMGLSAERVEQALFADLKSEQRLVRFQEMTPVQLLERYNVACAQAVLLRATHVQVEIRGASVRNLRHLLQAIKFHRLLIDVESSAEGLATLRLDGPLSLFQNTTKYGLQLALFLPHLLLCRDYELRAEILWGPKRTAKEFVLTAADGLKSHLPDTTRYVPPECEMFAELFRRKTSAWEIIESADLIPVGKGWWVPDFRLVHQATGKVVFLEILGYWRRHSAERHLQALRDGVKAPYLVALSDQLRLDEGDSWPEGVVRFRTLPQPDEIIRAAQALVLTQDLFG